MSDLDLINSKTKELPPKFQEWLAPLLEKIQLGQKRFDLKGLWGAARGLFIAALHAMQPHPILAVTAYAPEASILFQDIEFFKKIFKGQSGNLHYFPTWETLPYEPLSPQPEISAQRLQTLYHLLSGPQNPLLITPLSALMQKIIPGTVLGSSAEWLSVGEEVSREKIARILSCGGYQPVDMVERRDEFSVRGGIIDFFGPTSAHPVRIEFFGDEIASIRTFNYETQRSLEKLEEIIILPAREAVLTPETIGRLRENIEKYGADSPNLQEDLLSKLDLSRHFEGIEQYIPYLYSKTDLLLDYLPSDTIILIDEPDYVEKQGVDYEEKIDKEYKLIGKTPYPPPKESYLEWDKISRLLNKYTQINMASLSISKRETAGPITFEVKSPELVKIQMQNRQEKGYLSQLADKIQAWAEHGESVLLVCSSDGQAQRMQEVLMDYDLVSSIIHNLNWEAGQKLGGGKDGIFITIGELSAGFRIPSLSLVILSETDIFGEPKKVRSRSNYKSSRFLSTFSDLQVGDFIVHVDHGIGRYLGLTKLELENRILDFLLIEYQDNDKLYVPLDRLYLVQKYMGGDEDHVELHKMGGKKWIRQKESIKENLLQMADELVKIYAERSVMGGYKFSSDTHWQKEFEASFNFTETPDQLRAIEDVKSDMEQGKAMDRLVCGDVGFGKTEVALRAAFKAVMDGKQVAVLVPTTILAQQHYNTFSRRLAAYPFAVEMFSRFKTPRERTRIKEGLKKRTVDIVIGTHGLLQKEIKFADLGLLVVDEEQHFGVRHKERIKALRQSVDVLTLTATPIPRTLNLAMSGLRDLSIIDTPPEGRLDIHTEVIPYDGTIIREAILREMARGGQVFFIHNRVETIELIADQVRKLVPEAKIIVAHGQMPEKVLENIILKFMEGKYDVLLSTTIIESGMDISNANTIIINRADTFGLAQLYQLRGRVGRCAHRAYAYLLIPPGRILSKNAHKRLQAIQELSELGAGFRLAAHDLEIRGSGNILGPQQHGHIAAVGFDLYCQLMEEAVAEIQGRPSNKPIEPLLELNINARLSEEFIPDTNQRLTLYKRLSTAEDREELKRLNDEMQDRYGQLPKEALTLLEVMSLKISARELGILKIQREKGSFRITFSEQTPVSPEKVIKYIHNNQKTTSLTPENQLLVRQIAKEEDKICLELEKIFVALQK